MDKIIPLVCVGDFKFDFQLNEAGDLLITVYEPDVPVDGGSGRCVDIIVDRKLRVVHG